MSLVKICVLLTLIAVVSARLSYYYAPQGLNYHPPYDKYTGAYDINGTTGAASCRNTFTCPAGTTRQANPNFTPNIASGCVVPSWITDAAALSRYNGCCQRYSACIQTCGVNKAFCDGQFYGCSYSSCDPQRILRPADRLYCRSLSSCYASYQTRGAACSQFNDYQNSACRCVAGGASPSPSSSPVINTGKRQVATETSSPIPSASVTASSLSTSFSQSSLSVSQSSLSVSQSSLSISQSPLSVSPSSVSTTPTIAASLATDLYAARFGNYFVRPIPRWEVFQNRCPPNFENYVAVFTDQEQDDIGYYGRAQGSASSISSWLKF